MHRREFLQQTTAAAGLFGLPGAVAALNGRIAMPASLRDMGVPPGVVDRVVDGALADHTVPTNPRPLTASDLRTLFFDAYG